MQSPLQAQLKHLGKNGETLMLSLCRYGHIYYDYYIKEREWYELREKNTWSIVITTFKEPFIVIRIQLKLLKMQVY